MYNEVTHFMFYMLNNWCQSEAIHVFGNNLGNHIFEKWVHYHNDLRWYSELDTSCKNKLVKRANELYG